MWNRKRARIAEAIVDRAEDHVGYRANPNRQSRIQIPAYNGRPWAGSFVDLVLQEAFGGLPEVRFISTVTALGYYVKANRVYLKPQRGDIVFYNFATDPALMFEQPHVGIVVELKPNGVFTAIEGETSPGTPQGSQLADGVFLRERHIADAIGFVRPRARGTVTADAEPVKVRMAYLNSNPKTRAKAVANIQAALNRVIGGKFTQGRLDRETRSKFGAYSRERGIIENRGDLDYRSLTQLADETGALDIEP